MIRLSTKGRYGTRLMLNLAQHHKKDQRATILKNVSKDEDISIRYLEQIIIPLKISKLVKSIRGAGGGYILARHPEEIHLGEILQALEGTCCLVECVEDHEYCERMSECATHEVWEHASNMLRDYFESISLQDLMARAEKIKKKQKSAKRKSKSAQ
ncbi:MAG: Rrf2 family transcriptional regulator [Candidatus Aminicenantes bacterium]|nr:Rrf2 family transcriptional regulator [Candidatus Aminicenantes bacterium]